jgi:menaquinone-dependent protoporphyrinogen oxidase
MVKYYRLPPLTIRARSKAQASKNVNPNTLRKKPLLNVVARKPEKSKPENNPYLQKFLKRISWEPGELAVFAGMIDYPSYRFFDRLMIRLIMWMTKGPTDPRAVVEFTDWEQVEYFGRRNSAM